MSEPYWLSRVTPRPGIGIRQVARLGELDPYGQHQSLYKLFNLPPKMERKPDLRTPFLFRAERIEPTSAIAYENSELVGLPLFYVLSKQRPEERLDLWHVETNPNGYRPSLRAGDHLAFRLRANPVTLAKAERSEEERQAWLKNRVANHLQEKESTKKKRVRHDVVMDAKWCMGWKDLPKDQRPTLSQVAYEAGSSWLIKRQAALGCNFDETRLQVDGYRTWRGHKKNIEISMLDFEGVLTVTDPTRLLEALLLGIGPAKAFGCGLLLVRRLS